MNFDHLSYFETFSLKLDLHMKCFFVISQLELICVQCWIPLQRISGQLRYKLICTKYSFTHTFIQRHNTTFFRYSLSWGQKRGEEVGGTNCAKIGKKWILSSKRGQLKREKRLKIFSSLRAARWTLLLKLWWNITCCIQVGRGTYGHVYKAKRKDGWGNKRNGTQFCSLSWLI